MWLLICLAVTALLSWFVCSQLGNGRKVAIVLAILFVIANYRVFSFLFMMLWFVLIGGPGERR